MLVDLCMDVFFSGIASAFVSIPERVSKGNDISDLVSRTVYGFYIVSGGEVEYVEGIYWHSVGNIIHVEVDLGDNDKYRLLGIKTMMRTYNWGDVIGYVDI